MGLSMVGLHVALPEPAEPTAVDVALASAQAEPVPAPASPEPPGAAVEPTAFPPPAVTERPSLMRPPPPPIPAKPVAPKQVPRPSPQPVARPEPPSAKAAASDAPAHPVTAGTDEIAAWRLAMAAWFAAHRDYPNEARRDGITGRVVLRFSIDPSGAVVDVSVARGSGSGMLDSAAEALLRGAHLPPPPDGRTLRITQPIDYQLN